MKLKQNSVNDIEQLKELLLEMMDATQQNDWDSLGRAESSWSLLMKSCLEKNNGHWLQNHRLQIEEQMNEYQKLLEQLDIQKKALFDELRTLRKSQNVVNAYREH